MELLSSKKSFLLFFILIISVFVISSIQVSAGSPIYVDDDNTEGPWDGSIDNPYQYIQDGIDATDINGTLHSQ